MKSEHITSTHPARTDAAAPALKHIVVPTDFSETSRKAIRYAVRFAEQYGATIHLVHVIEPPGFTGDTESYPLVVPPAEDSGSCKEKLFSLANEDIEELVPVKADVRIGKAADEICDLAKESQADLIIIATHGRTGLSRVLLGSTTEHVVRRAPCPVLVVREREHEFV